MPDLSRLGIVGSRNWPSKGFVFGILHAIVKNHEVEVVVSGGQPKGVDGWAEDFADAVGLEKSLHLPAHWLDESDPRHKPYAVANYYERNQLIVDDSTYVLAFCWKGSSGTMDTVGRCGKDGVPCRVFTEDDLATFRKRKQKCKDSQYS